WDPKNADHFGLTDDAGARVTTDHGRSFLSIAIPNGQMYHVSVDQQVPYWILTNRQDNGTMRGPSTAPEAPPSTGGGAGFGNPGGGAGAVSDTTGGRGGRAAVAAADTSGGGGGGGGGGSGRGGGFSTWDRGL